MEMQQQELEQLTLAEQMQLLASSSALLAVHGQAMAWVLFLPSHRRRVAALEIFPGSAKPFKREEDGTEFYPDYGMPPSGWEPRPNV